MDNEQDLYEASQLALIRVSDIDKICVYLNLHKDHAEEAMARFMKWNHKEIKFHEDNGQRSPLKTMFDCLRGREHCELVCEKPEEHFKAGHCAPIGMVYHELSQISLAASKIFTSGEVRHYVIEELHKRRSNGQSVVPLADYDLPLITLSSHKSVNLFDLMFGCLKKVPEKKRTLNVFLTDALHCEQICERHSGYMVNLIQNLSGNFELYIAPDEETDNFEAWKDFFETQLRSNSDVIVLVVTPFLISVLNQEVTEDSFRTHRINHMWERMRHQGKPIYGVVFDAALLEQARQRTSFVFELPRQLKDLLHMIQRRGHDWVV